MPCAVGLAVLAGPIVRVLFERGEFDHAATLRTARVLVAFAGAVAAGCVAPTITRAFYAEQDTKTPVRVSVIAVVANCALNLILVGPLKEAGLALATTISQVGQLVALTWIQARRRRAQGGDAGWGPLAVGFVRSGLLCLGLAAAALGTHTSLAAVFGDAFEAHGSIRALVLALAIGAGALAYVGLAWFTDAPELHALIDVRALNRKGGAAAVAAPIA
jgi:putative peptidoglycan lipid II flippase